MSSGSQRYDGYRRGLNGQGKYGFFDFPSSKREEREARDRGYYQGKQDRERMRAQEKSRRNK